MKSWEGQIDTKAVGFNEDTEDIENHEICPFMSLSGRYELGVEKIVVFIEANEEVFNKGLN